jgi:thioredoxin 1
MSSVLDEITTIDEYKRQLLDNPGLVIFKFSAPWCAPCQKIAPQVEAWFHKMPANVQTIVIDVDESIDLYAFMKSKKMLKGIPALLMYKKGNLNYVFDDCVNTSDPAQIDAFFERCIHAAKEIDH